MSVIIRDNQLVITSDELRGVKSPPLPRSVPARKVVVLGDVSNTGEIVHCESLTPTIESKGIVYHYCGVSDGIGYYRTTEEVKEINTLVADGGKL